uniref:MARVEL domain-containing protein n=1 Tax=Strongyloides papillosus TaxID=174720 RepID=A0A0N5B7L7_STREA
MVSQKSSTWSIIIIQLVFSIVIFISSLAVIAAQSNSFNRYGQQQEPSILMILAAVVSFSMILSTILAMFALAHHVKTWLIPHMITASIMWCFHIVFTFIWLNDIAIYGTSIIDWLLTILLSLLIQAFILGSIYLDSQCYRGMV